MTTNSTSNLISKQEIVGMKYMETFKRQVGFGFYDREVDTQNKELIDERIDNGRDFEHRYFDKYGNEFTLNEISK